MKPVREPAAGTGSRRPYKGHTYPEARIGDQANLRTRRKLRELPANVNLDGEVLPFLQKQEVPMAFLLRDPVPQREGRMLTVESYICGETRAGELNSQLTGLTG